MRNETLEQFKERISKRLKELSEGAKHDAASDYTKEHNRQLCYGKQGAYAYAAKIVLGEAW